MEQARVLKLKLHTTAEQSAKLLAVSSAYRDACDFVSTYFFDHGCSMSARQLHKKLYHMIRERFGLKSQMACSVFRTVAARYAAVETQIKKKPFRMDDVTIPRTLDWLWYPVRFRALQADLVRGRDFSFFPDGISVNTLEKRILLPFDVHLPMKYMTEGWMVGGGKLVYRKRVWYLHLSMVREFPELERKEVTAVKGIDRGIRFPATVYDGKDTSFERGGTIRKKRETFLNVRSELQSRGTKSAKRKLKAISGRENRWMGDVNHCLSKTLVRNSMPGTLFVLEDLVDVSHGRDQGKGRNRELSSWTFYDLEQKLRYKAVEAGMAVLTVPADYTSQRCPVCGEIRKENRDHKNHEYRCSSCGFRTNDDRVGGMNLYQLGIRWLKGEERPKYSLSRA